MSYSFEQVRILTGDHLELKPLSQEELPAVAQALISPTTWFSRTRDLTTPEKFISYFAALLERQKLGETLTLVARLRESGEIVAMSTYQYPSAGFRRVEIGFSWIADGWQRTFVNSEMKFLMLEHAFDGMKTNRVEFSVHPTNEKSNAAMKRLGGVFEGTLRKWRYIPGAAGDDGHRNIYSILDEEWPRVRERLVARRG